MAETCAARGARPVKPGPGLTGDAGIYDLYMWYIFYIFSSVVYDSFSQPNAFQTREIFVVLIREGDL